MSVGLLIRFGDGGAEFSRRLKFSEIMMNKKEAQLFSGASRRVRFCGSVSDFRPSHRARFSIP